MRVLMIIVTIASASGVNAETLPLATAPDFYEEMLPEARISGGLVVGAQHQGSFNETIAVATNVPAAWAGEVVCARVSSVDGTYVATNEYTVPANWPGGSTMLDYPTQHGDFLKGIEHDGIGLRVTRGTCGLFHEEMTISSWNDGTDKPPAILINSFQADSSFIYIGDNTTPVRCTPVALDGRSAYDTRCQLDTLPDETSVRVEILRVINGQPAPPTSLVLWLAGG